MDTTKRPLSWSQISCFEWNKEVWYKRYILNEKQDENQAMKFGKMIGEKLAGDSTFMPAIPRYHIYEYKLLGRIGDIHMIGFIDGFDLKKKLLMELKTGKKWDKKKAETHGQIDLYCALLYIMHKIDPEDLDIRLIWLETEETGDFETRFIKDMEPVVFKVKKSMVDVVNMLARVKRIYSEMEEFIHTRS